MERFFDKDYYYNLAIGAYKKWKGYVCSSTYNLFVHKEMMIKFEKDNHFSQNEIENTIKEYVDELFDKSEKEIKEEIEKVIDYTIEPKVTQIFSSDSKEIKTKKSFMVLCSASIKYYIYDMMYTLIILKGHYKNKSFLFNNDYSYNNRIVVDELFDTNGELNLDNNSLFQKYSYNYTKWLDDAKKCINNLIVSKEESFILSYLDFENFFYNIPFNPDTIENCFTGKIKCLFFTVNQLRETFCKKARECINVDHVIDGVFLPIGLVSSSVLSEIYMCEFDKKVADIGNISYYGRYCDDIFFIYKNYDKNNFIDDFEEVFSFDDSKLSVGKHI